MKVVKERSSNFELLRIVAMLMIVLHHLCLYGYNDGGVGVDPISLIRNVMMLGGKIGVDVFVLISGYFLARGKIKITSFLRVLFEALFYSFALGLLCAVFAPTAFDATSYMKSFLPASGGLPWFVTAYLGMYIMAPWLAKLSSVLDKNAFKQLIIVGFIVFSFIPTFPACKFVTSDFTWFCYLFMVACYLRRFDIDTIFARHLLVGGGAFLWCRCWLSRRSRSNSPAY